jgi:kynurenine formamidase
MNSLSWSRIVDLSVPISEMHPSSWPAHMPFQHKTYNWYSSGATPTQELTDYQGPYATKWLAIDEHTGTHIDAPTHFIPPVSTGLDYANEWGDVSVEKLPLEQLVGNACVLDAPIGAEVSAGNSPLFEPEHIESWEEKHHTLSEGDVVLLRSGWDDRYVEGAENRRYAYNVFVQGSEPGWPAPSESAMQLLVDRGVKLVGTDGPTMGPAQGGRDVHLIGLGAGTCFIECMANLSELPETGAFFVFLPLKIVNGTGAPGRAIAFIP